MIRLDTNILIRYLTRDDPVQSAKATEILERRLTPKNPGFASIVAMVETVWVLDRAYGLTAQEIATAVERLLQVEVLAIDNEQEVFTAMVALKQGRGSFADALIAELGARAGCTRTLTLTKKHPDFLPSSLRNRPRFRLAPLPYHFPFGYHYQCIDCSQWLCLCRSPMHELVRKRLSADQSAIPFMLTSHMTSHYN